MTFDEYQNKADDTAIYTEAKYMNSLRNRMSYVTLGLVSEAGEVAGKLKKIFRDHEGYISLDQRTALLDEVGDVLWYCAQICTELGADLVDVAQRNIDKLTSRADRGALSGSGDKR